MDPRSLDTASKYINNLLLARGLLRDGLSIDFAITENDKGGSGATMAKVMNLVHDLILRRDREADTLGSLSQNVQTLSATSAQQAQSISRLEARNAELDRQLALSSAQEQVAKKTLKNAETRLRALKEEMAKLKGTVGQIRQQCANDVRRRDQELARLKRHLEVRRGREGNGSQGGMIVITPGLTKPQPGNRSIGSEVDVSSSQYSLRQETTEFLTQLSQGLSDENDALIGLVRRTLSTLRTLQGLPAGSSLDLYCCNDTGKAESTNVVMTAPPTYEDLAASTEEVLNHLQGILTNPSFVPLAEVEVREDEIIKLREGWEKMEARWREAVILMDGWRKRMEHTGDTINLDDLKIGIELGTGLPEAPSLRHLQQLPRTDESVTNGSLSLGVLHENSPKLSDKHDDGAAQPHAAPLIEPRENKILQAKSGNSRLSFLPRKVSFPVIPEENTKAIRDFENELILDLCGHDDLDTLARSASPDPKEASSPISSPRSIQQKLEKARTEADETRRREEKTGKRRSGVIKKLKGSRRRSTLSPEELEKLMGLV